MQGDESMTGPLRLIEPDWPAPACVRALATTRVGGASEAPWDSLNLGDHVGDDPIAVARNRAHLARQVGVEPGAIHWLEQVHGTQVLELDGAAVAGQADAATTAQAGQICAILTADCLPVLFCDDQGRRVAAAHAGWRGLVAGVLENTLARFEQAGATLVWLGPAIGPAAFEVGPEVRQAFLAQDPAAGGCFVPSPQTPGHFLADIYELARRRLRAAGVRRIFGGNHCTVRESDQFFSFRRNGKTGRQAALIWLSPSGSPNSQPQ